MKKLLTLLMFVGAGVAAKAQSGEISGKVLDDNGEAVISGLVVVIDEKGNNTSTGTTTDFDGNYSLKPLPPGSYNIRFSYVGLQPKVFNGVSVSADKVTALDVKLEPQSATKGDVVITWEKPLIEKASTTIDYTLDKKDIKNAVTQNISDLASQSAGAFQQDAGGAIQLRGSRVSTDANTGLQTSDGVTYYVNGIKRFGTPKVPVQSIEQMTVVAGGVPARYGDASAGIINITTKGGGVSEFGGSASFQTSQGLDAYGYNQVNANLMGPIVRKGKGENRRTVFGFSASFEFTGQKDRSPINGGVWQVKPDVLNNIRQNPISQNPNGSNLFLTANNLTFGDLYKTAARPNNSGQDYKGVLQFEISPAKGINILAGGDLTYSKFNNYVAQYTLLTPQSNPLYNILNYTGFVRFSHLVGEGKQKKESSSAYVENIYYSIQADFQKNKITYGSPTLGNNLWDYGYIGKFDIDRVGNFQFTNSNVGGKTYNGFVQTGQYGTTDLNITYTPGTQNPDAARYTTQYFEYLGATQAADGSYTPTANPISGGILSIQSELIPLVNGMRPQNVYQTWYATGRIYNGYGIANNDNQYRVRGDVSFDIQKPGATTNKHSIEAGFEFEQRVQRSYNISPLGLWTLARNEVNRHLSLDTSNPIFRINGQQYTLQTLGNTAFNSNDTIAYNLVSNPEMQTTFDKNLRRALGIGASDLINVDALNPNQLNVNMFSATELMTYVDPDIQRGIMSNVYGYDYYGNMLTGSPSVDDFFHKKDADGNYLRQQGAFKPIYVAGYIQDKFTFKDLGFLVGLRLDRYDANQYVLKDKYSLYDIKTAGEVTTLDGQPVNRPDNIGNDYAVYVTKYGSGAQIAGYREGETWYDKYGNVANAKDIAAAGASGILPYLNLPGVDSMSYASAKNYIQARTDDYNPSSSFVKYSPKYIVQPRLQFSFNITDKAQFFAHYDVLSQRPSGYNILSLASYYNWPTQGSGTYTMNNPNLKPQTTIDFELGFKQVVTKTSSLTLSVYYKEYRNLIDIRKIQYAFPTDYLTYDNIDFQTVKGLNAIYDMRRTGNFKMNVNYTLQFAEGTGDNASAQYNLTQSNVQFFRSIYPASYDARHTINLMLDWHWAEGKDYDGPVIGNKQIFANFGINARIMARSGTPYSGTSTSTTEAINSLYAYGRMTTTSLNGQRLPWQFRVDLRINKDFAINVSRKGEDKDPKKIYLSIYLWIQNLLNTKNVLSVYRYTGNAGDDGYLENPANAIAVERAQNPQAFNDLYRAALSMGTNTSNYTMPRRIYLGASINF